MGLPRKIMSVATLGLVDFRPEQERMAGHKKRTALQAWWNPTGQGLPDLCVVCGNPDWNYRSERHPKFLLCEPCFRNNVECGYGAESAKKWPWSDTWDQVNSRYEPEPTHEPTRWDTHHGAPPPARSSGTRNSNHVWVLNAIPVKPSGPK